MDASTRIVERRLAKPATDTQAKDLLRTRFRKLRRRVGPIIMSVRMGEGLSRQDLASKLPNIVPQIWGMPDEQLVEDIESQKYILTYVEFANICGALGRFQDALLDAAELEVIGED
jgi:ribosome-binding protein aMBF1 (putative translation factor)